MKPRSSSYRSLDIFRGFAAFWVVMCHSCAPWLDKHPDFYSNPLYAFSIKGQLGVVIFFVISGYCITAAVYGAGRSGKSLGRYAYERARRIYPPYLFALIVTAGENLAIQAAADHHLIAPLHHDVAVGSSFKYWVSNLLLVQYELHTSFVSMVFWSLCYEVAFYGIMGAFLYGAKKFGLRVLPYALGISTIASLTYLLVVSKPFFPFDTWHLFSLGGLLFFILETNADGLRRVALSLSAIVCVLLCLYALLRQVGTVDAGHPSSGVESIAALLFCLFLAAIRKYDDRIFHMRLLQPLLFVGTFSYSLYLIHPAILPIVDIASRKAGLDGKLYLFTFAIQIAVAVVAGRLTFLGVERFFLSKKQAVRLESEGVAV